LIEQAFEQITDEQLVAFELKTGRLRMDSTQIASNIQQYSRLQLLVEIMPRTWRMLNQVEQSHYAEAFGPYLKGSSGQYVYHLKGQETKGHLQQIGELMQRLLTELRAAYADHQTYQILERVFAEQFRVAAAPACGQSDDEFPHKPPPSGSVQVKPAQEISPDSLRSPDDTTATYRKKGGQAYQGYVTNLTETCDPANDLQLIVKVQTEPNTTEDADLLGAALPNLMRRTELDHLYNDAAFCSPAVDEALRPAGIKQIPSALQGRAPDPRYTHLADFHFQLDPAGHPLKMTCPHGQTLTLEHDLEAERSVASFTQNPCAECRFRKSQSRSSFRFTQAEFDVALRRQRCRAYRHTKPQLRAAVEATVGAIKRPFNNDKTPVRGKFRVGLMMIGSAAMVNIRRIERYLLNNSTQQRQVIGANPTLETDKHHIGHSALSFLATICTYCRLWPSFNRRRWPTPRFSF
jgi:hypothetical protein